MEGLSKKILVPATLLALALAMAAACVTNDVQAPEPVAEAEVTPESEVTQDAEATQEAEATPEPEPTETPPPHLATQIAMRAEGYKTIYIVTETQPGIYGFKPNEITLEEGDNVRLLLKGEVEPEGYGYHTFTLPSQGFSVLVPARTKSVWLSFDQPGEFEFYCIPHPWMRGLITVLPKDEAAKQP